VFYIHSHWLHTLLTLLWPVRHICPTYKESFQVRWDNSIPLFLLAAIYLEVSLFRWTSQNAFSRETAVYKWYSVQCCMQHVTNRHLSLYNSGSLLLVPLCSCSQCHCLDQSFRGTQGLLVRLSGYPAICSLLTKIGIPDLLNKWRNVWRRNCGIRWFGTAGSRTWCSKRTAE